MDNKQFILSDLIDITFSTPSTFSHWFGYYNYSPLDSSGTRLLAHRIDFDARLITSDDTAELGWFNLNDASWHSIGKTRAFNWQQGAMLQWLGYEEIVFNDVMDNHFVSKIVKANGTDIRVIPWPVYGITPNGKMSISLQFERSYWCRAYHYEAIRNPKWDVRIAEEDGIFQVDLENGDYKQIVFIKDILKLDYDPIFEKSKHWIEHIMINPSGQRFAFYHRFDDGSGFKTRVLTANIDGTGIFLVPGWRDNGWSHMGWQDNNKYVIFGVKRVLAGKTYDVITKNTGKLGKLLKNTYHRYVYPIMNKKTHSKMTSSGSYQLYSDQIGMIGGYSKGNLSNDGHPSFSLDGRYMLADTYADENSYRHLFLFDTASEKLFTLGSFFSPYNNCEYRSDLHPRFSLDNKYIIIDSAHSGKHQMLVFKVNWDLIIKSSKL